MNKYLAIDTSSGYLNVFVRNGKKRVCRFLPDCAMRHSVVLAGETDKAFEEAGLKPADCDFFAAVTGPGSFTGIRIGVATVKGFALAADKPLVSVTSFDLAAYNVTDENFYVVIDAAHSHYYVCGYGKDKKITLAPCYLSENQVKELKFPLYGFENLPLENYTALSVKDCLPVAVEALKGNLSHGMQALYVRKSQAEENLGASKRVEI